MKNLPSHTSSIDRSEEEKYKILQPTLELNTTHPLILSLHSLKNTDADLARMVTEQVRLSFRFIPSFLTFCLFLFIF